MSEISSHGARWHNQRSINMVEHDERAKNDLRELAKQVLANRVNGLPPSDILGQDTEEEHTSNDLAGIINPDSSDLCISQRPVMLIVGQLTIQAGSVVIQSPGMKVQIANVTPVVNLDLQPQIHVESPTINMEPASIVVNVPEPVVKEVSVSVTQRQLPNSFTTRTITIEGPNGSYTGTVATTHPRHPNEE